MTWIEIEVETDPNLSNISRTENIPEETIELLIPLLLQIQESEGWFRTGDFISPINGKSAEDEYGYWMGWNILTQLLPKPESGIYRISRVTSPVISLYM